MMNSVSKKLYLSVCFIVGHSSQILIPERLFLSQTEVCLSVEMHVQDFFCGRESPATNKENNIFPSLIFNSLQLFSWKNVKFSPASFQSNRKGAE